MRRLRGKSFSEFGVLFSTNKCYYGCNVCHTVLKNVIFMVMVVCPMMQVVSCHPNKKRKKSVKKKCDCRFTTTNFNSTKLKIHLQAMNVKGRYC